jgi:hypothetical protein
LGGYFYGGDTSPHRSDSSQKPILYHRITSKTLDFLENYEKFWSFFLLQKNQFCLFSKKKFSVFKTVQKEEKTRGTKIIQ